MYPHHSLSRRDFCLTASLAGIAATLPRTAVAAPNAQEIMEKVSLTRRLSGSEAVVEMIMIAKGGEERKRKLSVATKLFDDGKTEKRIYRFLEPSDVKGTGVLVFDYESKADDVWIYLPALRKTRRVVSSERSKSFMGSEFSYADLNIPEISAYSYTFVKEEAVAGQTCWVIDVLPVSQDTGKEEGYSKKTYWISKDHYVVRKGIFYDMAGKKVKTLVCNDIKLLDKDQKRYRPMIMEMVNEQNGRRSVFKTEKIAFSPSVADDLFTTRYLERA